MRALIYEEFLILINLIQGFSVVLSVNYDALKSERIGVQPVMMRLSYYLAGLQLP